ncbi:MAG: hypothetical protein VX043_02725 [Candidatus Thermoplasmatota archaeon]|nr:hypothetical protein [Candidatus Thermoplasmatota archaeon]MEC8249416.1 hypothetical protein [Candidatus Thermoplasmatota archaeon]MEC8312846.1 hypothetical protein [Candidatus Thermoplasmatota archaeon]
MKGNASRGFFVEALVVALVLFSAMSLYFNGDIDEAKERKLVSLSGDIELSTRDSMDAFGLNDFKLGAVANLDISATHIESGECLDCSGSIRGVQLAGSVIITQLIDQENRLGRVEGTLNFTHLVVHSAAKYVSHEHISFDWYAGDITSSWEVHINHNPPRWLPKFDINTLFIETSHGLESRSGPEILIKEPSHNTRVIQACLPDSFLCRSASPDAVMVATYSDTPSVIFVNETTDWNQISRVNNSNNMTTNTLISELFNLDKNISSEYGFAPHSDSQYEIFATYDISGNSVRFTPLSAWFYAIGLMPLEFSTDGESLVLLGNETVEIYNILSGGGSLKLGLIIY